MDYTDNTPVMSSIVEIVQGKLHGGTSSYIHRAHGRVHNLNVIGEEASGPGMVSISFW